MLTGISVPVNLKDRDAFHITLEDYLLAVTELVQELVSHAHATPTGWRLICLGSTCRELCNTGRLFPPSADQQVHQRRPCGLSAVESQERRAA